jgi:hypothetical protein
MIIEKINKKENFTIEDMKIIQKDVKDPYGYEIKKKIVEIWN